MVVRVDDAWLHGTAEADYLIPRTPDDLSERLLALATMSLVDLRSAWRRLYRAAPPQKISRDLLELAVAWKLQEQALGGLSATAKRRLVELGRTLESRGDLTRSRTFKLKPGVRLLREWQGETHEVLVTENGFQWQGRSWPSLSVIARTITRAHWSGPRFFGLAKSRNKASPPRPECGSRADA